MARLSERDASEWARLGGRVARALEPWLSRSVLANRAVLDRRSWRLGEVGPSLATARRRAAALSLTSPVVLRTDVLEFYPSVRPTTLHDAVVGLVGRRDARRAAAMLDGWGSEGYGGLPIGPHASAVMANAVLRCADATLAATPFLRWVDDYLVGVRDERHAAETLDRLDAALDRGGLRRSSVKTLLAEGGRPIPWPGTLSGSRSSKPPTCGERGSASL